MRNLAKIQKTPKHVLPPWLGLSDVPGVKSGHVIPKKNCPYYFRHSAVLSEKKKYPNLFGIQFHSPLEYIALDLTMEIGEYA